LDGVIGHWDESRTFHVRQKPLMYLAALSCNFRIIAFATSKSKGVVTRLCYWLSEKDQNRASIVFDAVYVL